jgi:hypothetical protein
MRRRPGRRLCLEALEDRLAPAVVTWSGGPTGLGTDWNDRTNWVGNAVPGSADDAVIGAASQSVTITSSGTVSVHSVSSEAAIQINGGTFSLAPAVSVFDGDVSNNGAMLRLTGSTMSGRGTLTNAGEIDPLESTINMTLNNGGRIVVLGSTNAFNGALTETPAGSMHYHPNSSPGGKWLLYGSKRDGVRQLYVMRLEDKKERRLTDLTKGHAAMWAGWQP